MSCAIAGALTIALSGAPEGRQIVAIILFIAVAISSIAVPVVILQIRGDAATPLLNRLRSWIAGHSHVLKALLLVVIATRQISKVLQSL